MIVQRIEGLKPTEARDLADRMKQKLGSGIVVLGSADGEKAFLVVGVTKDLTSRVSAAEVIKVLAPLIGGGGGGRPDFAQAGGTATGELDKALEHSLVFPGKAPDESPLKRIEPGRRFDENRNDAHDREGPLSGRRAVGNGSSFRFPPRPGSAGEIQKKAASYDPIVRRIANSYVIDPALVHSIIAAESAYNRFAGLGQGRPGIDAAHARDRQGLRRRGLLRCRPEHRRRSEIPQGPAEILSGADRSRPGRVQRRTESGREDTKAFPRIAETKTYVARVKRYLQRDVGDQDGRRSTKTDR